jgi:transcriptional regulator with XRE-family HTH domain
MNKRVVQIRKSNKLSQSEFAKKLGFTQSNLSLIELGKIPLTKTNIRLICLTFGVREEWLRTGGGAMFDHEAMISDKEKRLLELFRQLSETAQDMLIEYAEKLKADERALRQEAQKQAAGGVALSPEVRQEEN